MRLRDSVQLRLAAFAFLNNETRVSPYVSRERLESFSYQGHRLALISGYRGIHKPGDWDTVLSVLSTERRPDQGGYDDVERDDGTLLYRFMNNPGKELNAYNRALLKTSELGLPLILLEKKAPKVFEAFYPVWIVGSSSEGVVVSYQTPNSELGEIVDLAAEAGTGSDIRDYVKSTAKRRIHQEVFRSRVLSAYGDRCAICKLGRRGLLDAAHIIDDSHADGHAIVPNGLALCRIHHGAYDQFLIGIRPDRTIEVAHDVLEEVDGPMLQHGLKDIDQQRIRIPRSTRNQPDPRRLQWKYEKYLTHMR